MTGERTEKTGHIGGRCAPADELLGNSGCNQIVRLEIGIVFCDEGIRSSNFSARWAKMTTS
jgi:hypothetical protein